MLTDDEPYIPVPLNLKVEPFDTECTHNHLQLEHILQHCNKANLQDIHTKFLHLFL